VSGAQDAGYRPFVVSTAPRPAWDAPVLPVRLLTNALSLPLQVYDVLNADRIVVEQAALAYINSWFGGGEQ
jgi:ribosomal protein L4